MPRRTVLSRPLVRERKDKCGVQEQPMGYYCSLVKGHRGNHKAVASDRKIIASWSARAEWHGPVLHGVAQPSSARTLCGAPAGTRANPITYEARLVRCAACLAILTPREKVVPARRRK